MTPNWVTADKFAEMTGLASSTVKTACRSGAWPENVAWRRLSDRIYLISIGWWDKWHETEAASKRRQKAALRSNSSTTGNDAESASSASPRLPTLDD